MSFHIRPAGLCLALVVLLTLLAAGAAGAEGEPEIGFVSGGVSQGWREGPFDIYTADADGAGLAELTGPYDSSYAWAWSPEGNRIAFLSPDGVGLYVRSLDQEEPLPAATAHADVTLGLAWSPTGTHIAFVSGGHIRVLEVTTGSIVDFSGSDPYRWSPTGSHLMYTVRRDEADGSDYTIDTYVVGASGGVPVNLTSSSTGTRTAFARWSPDGSRLAFVTDRDGNEEIYVADGAGGDQVRLTNDPANDRSPTWSPDGSQILYSSGGVPRWQLPDYEGTITPSRLWVMDADGSNKRRLTDSSIDPPDIDLSYPTEASHQGVWSPDGTRIAVVSSFYGRGPHQRSFDVFVMRADGDDDPTPVWSGGGGWWLEWSPDGRRLAIRSSGNYGIDGKTVVVDADGTGAALQLTGGVGSGFAGWSRYGTHLAYENSGGAGPGDTVFVAAADGTSPIAITDGLDAPVNSWAAWRPQPVGPVGLVDTSRGEWHLDDGWGRITTFYYGDPGDVPFVGDWDCDGVDTPGLYRRSDGFAYLRNSNTQGIADARFFFGNPDDVPLAGDFNGDGCDTVSIYRPSEQRFYIINRLGSEGTGLGAADYSFLFGDAGDQPVVGDWDGDGIDEVGLHRSTTGRFYWRETLTTGIADGSIVFGDPGDRFVAGDWGVVDGRDTPAVFRPATTVFYFRDTLTQGIAGFMLARPAAAAGWAPVAGDFGGG